MCIEIRASYLSEYLISRSQHTGDRCIILALDVSMISVSFEKRAGRKIPKFSVLLVENY